MGARLVKLVTKSPEAMILSSTKRHELGKKLYPESEPGQARTYIVALKH